MKQSDCYTIPAHLRAAIERTSPSGGQARCDRIQRDYRAEAGSTPAPRSIRRPAPPAPAPHVPTDDQLRLRLAEELDYACRLLESMGDDLASNAHIVARHMVSLQSLDILGQMLGHIASIVRSSDPAGAVDRVGMSDLKARLTRRAIV